MLKPALFAAALLAGCATGNPVQVAAVKVAAPEMVGKCQYLDTVYGTSGWYGLFSEAGMENARMSAFDKAQKLNGTHVTWEPATPGHGSTNIGARVYRCPA